MKPLMLAMQAFGPFAGNQIIDFAELDGRQFFLIHGPTGAGKTTILDAMCFALYGSSSGAERESWEMRSDHADPAVPTEVIFDFSVGEKVYRVSRRPRQERPKKRGAGSTVDDPQAVLWQSTAAAAPQGRQTVLAGQWERVTEKIEEILGFKSSQFRQVVMLPQGQFRQLLSADSRERQKILETLFHTEIYRIMEERLKEKAKQIGDDIKDAQRRIDILLDQAGVSTVSELAEKQEALNRILQDQQESIQQVRQEETNAQKEWNEAVGTSEKIKEREAANVESRLLEERQDEFKDKNLLLEAARRAFHLIDAEESLKGRQKEWEALSRSVASMTSQLAAAAEAAEEAEEAFRKEQAREPEREATLKIQNELTAMTAKVRALQEAKAELSQADEALKSSETRWLAAQKTLDDLRGRLEERKKAQTDASASAAQTATLKADHTEIQRVYDQRRRYEELQTAVVKARKHYDDILAEKQKTEHTRGILREDLISKEHLWQAGQAAILSAGLVAGEPCPVCGSREHPMPAASDTALPEEGELRRIREQLAQQERDLSAIRDRELQSRLEVERIETNAAVLKESLGDACEKSVSLLKRQVDDAQKALTAATDAGDRLKKLSDDVEKLQGEEIKDMEILENARKDHQLSIIQREKGAAVTRERETAVPEAWRDRGHLETELKKTAARIAALREGLRRAQEQNIAARENKIALEAALKEKTAALSDAAQKMNRDADDFQKRLSEAGFADKTAFETAKKNAQEIKSLDAEINAFSQARQTAQERARRAAEAAEGLAMPDMDRLAENIRTLKEKLTTLIGEQAELNSRRYQNDAVLNHLKVLFTRREKLEERYAVFGRISEVANGKNLYGMTFQRFVLAALLDDVLTATSARLKIMSRGRYELHRLRDKSKRPSGLELEVYDAYTGTMRGVATLSGGESFLASLSLALGLADVVQSYAGGIHLNTIFIDEGFGSLDPESLEQAMRALIDLQQGGRLVGVISHVPEMKEWIDVRLEITAGKQGSEARFVKG
ncbi:MAG: SMC family ATPase [Deltaproteobacteria bacterium]|nr:SMC family ATPase [Deltaproteobacteria bacterium]